MPSGNVCQLTTAQLKTMTFDEVHTLAENERQAIQRNIDELPNLRMTSDERKQAKAALLQENWEITYVEQTLWRNLHRKPDAGPNQATRG